MNIFYLISSVLRNDFILFFRVSMKLKREDGAEGNTE